MLQRLLLAYLGSIGLPFCLLPIAMIFPMAGHSAMYVTVLSAPLGLFIGLIYSDYRNQFTGRCILIRSLAALILFIIFFVILVWLTQSSVESPLYSNNSWLLIPIIAPAFAALPSDFFLRLVPRRKKTVSTSLEKL
jgi:hypothetical protein